VWVVLVCILPAVLVTAELVRSNYHLQREQVRSNTLLLARQIAAEVDRELSRVESGLRVLATSSDLLAGDLRSFHQRASDAVKSQIAYNYLLTDRDGRQLMNTLVPFGQPLPATGTPDEIKLVFEEGQPVVTDLFIGPVTNKFAIGIGVPVFRGDAIAYSLNIGLSPDVIGKILSRTALPNGWVARILDRSGTILAHSSGGERLIGQKVMEPLLEQVLREEEGFQESRSREGMQVITSFSHSMLWKWTVAISAPKAILETGLIRQIAWVVMGTVMALALGVWLALRLAGLVLGSVRELNTAALALCNGEPVELPGLQIKEAEAVGRAIVQASRTMGHIRHRAYHDGLTGLANRSLFEELLSHQFTLVERSKGRLAILALDLDGFKLINDQQGHAMGDEVLRIAAKRMVHAVRSSDTVARVGGDEFLIMLCDDDQAGAMHMAERLVASLSLPYPGVKMAASASVGVAVYPQSGTTIKSLIESADRALYRAKHMGKKRAVISLE
jgi:diguanylate cyclase (GGDEF)-like protein